MLLTSHRYASILLKLCQENQWDDTVYKDLKTIDHFLNVSVELNEFLLSPSFTHEQRLAAIHMLFDGKIDVITIKIIQFLEEKKHLHFLSEIIGYFLELYRESKNIQKITIVSSRYLSQDQIERICYKLHLKLHKTIEHDLVIDSSLIGGIKIFIGDIVYDFSFKNQLNRFKNDVLMSA